MKRDVWLYDPAGGGFMQVGNIFHVFASKVRIIGSCDVDCRFNPGALQVTQAALEQLGAAGVIAALERHLRCEWGAESAENDYAAANDEAIYNYDTPDVLIITYPGHNTTVILSEEY